jgi:hypothetical protein
MHTSTMDSGASHFIDVGTVRLGGEFQVAGRTITIRRSRSARRCACGLPCHHIAPGALCSITRNGSTGKQQYWHREHFSAWRMILLDQDGREIARWW